LIGTLIGNYRIVTELGGGAMGEVYFAEHTLMGRRAAIKIIREELSTHEETVQRFINEARQVNRIGHPNIVEITDFGQVGTRYYIMMELLEGETLEARLERVGRLDEATAVGIALQVVDALRAAHELGVVHRDLKPENVFLTTRAGQTDIVKVLDFGIAKLLHSANKSVSSTTPGAILGTPHYMSPEQCRGDEQLDHRSDVYSLGVLLYRMLTGKVPFERDTIMQILFAHMNDRPTPPRQLEPGVSVNRDALIMKALAKDPAQRFADMKELRAALSGKAFVALSDNSAEARRATQPAPSSEAEADQSRRVGSKLASILVERIHKDKLLLPSMPTAAHECIKLLDDPQQSLAKVALAIGRDPIIAPQVLRRAKSALLGRNAHVRTIEHAVARLGSRQLRALLFDLSARRLFDSRNPAIRRITRALWEHSVAVALLSRTIAQRRRDVDPEVAYLSGLLHDVGKPVAAALLLDLERSTAVAPAGWLASGAWLGVVQECHREVGVALARAWDLSEEIRLVIARCDRYAPEGAGCTASVVCLANALAKREGIYAGEFDAEQIDALIVEGQALFKFDDAVLTSLVAEFHKGESHPAAQNE
jgi:putative nucleotidyltransferase with HDIG domain